MGAEREHAGIRWLSITDPDFIAPKAKIPAESNRRGDKKAQNCGREEIVTFIDRVRMHSNGEGEELSASWEIPWQSRPAAA